MSTRPTPGTIRTDDCSKSSAGARFEVFVLYTGGRSTLVALRAADRLARGLGARVEVVVPEVVPYPLPLDRPPVAKSFSRRRYQRLAEQAGVETDIQVYLCREPREVLASTITPGSIVVIGARRRWWPTRGYRLGQWLRANGHRVVFVDEKSGEVGAGRSEDA